MRGYAVVVVALSVEGHYLRVDEHGRLRGDARDLHEADVFHRVDLGHGRVALRTAAGDHLTMLPDSGQNFGLYPRAELTPAAAFEEILWPTGQVSLRSAELTFVAVDGPGRVVTVNRIETPLNARLTYVRPPGVVPAQRTPSRPVAAPAGRMPAPREPRASLRVCR